MSETVQGKDADGAPFFVVATLTVRVDEVDAFEAFERAAMVVLVAHGAGVERIVRTESEEGLFRELHVVRFPDRSAFQAYRSDSRLADLQPHRERSVVRVELLEGRGRPDY